MGFETRRPFGNTGRMVCPIGISSGYGLDADGVEEAVDGGVNYLFSSAPRKKSFCEGIKRVARKNREDLIIVLQSYWRSFLGGLQNRSIERGLDAIGLDYIDVMVLGWFNRKPSQKLLDSALKLKEEGKVKLLGLSTHKRTVVPELAKEGAFQVFHVRYNAAHRGAEKDIFPHVDPLAGPGMVAFTATRWGHLMNPKKMPPGEEPLRASDAYRFCLTNPHIHTIAAGPKNRDHLKEALLAVEKGPLDEEELARIRKIGDHVYGKKTLMARA